MSSFEESQASKRKPRRKLSAGKQNTPRKQNTRRSPQEIIWGWGEDDIRHQGILERLSNLEKGFQLLLKEHRKRTVFLWIILASIWLNLATGHLQTMLQAFLRAVPNVLSGFWVVP
jgi:hypothetical protein